MSAVENVVARLEAAWRQAEAARAEAIGAAMAEKAAMPANYWREAFVARQKLAAAVALAEALQEIT